MAFFQKKPQTSTSAPLYSLGLEKTVIIAGLGNIGEKYHKTRHNIGFAVLDAFADSTESGSWIQKKDLQCHLISSMMGDTRVLLIKPTTLMNLSGESIQAVMQFYKVPLEQVVTVHDELDLPFGQIRCRMGGSAAGHNGIKSIIQHAGDNFGRIRIGVANEFSPQADSANFVLGKFTKDEQSELPNLTRETNAILTEYIYSGQLPHDTRSFNV
jgi:peptidyl-tRNA hydrolase, PTH1 family